jgi:glycosyltransferase involved in cell wall biosynthesis
MTAGTPPRALIVACNFPPDASVGTMRTLRLVQHLVRHGWTVDVLTLAIEGYRPGTVIDPALLTKVPGAVTVLRPRPLRPFERLASSLKRASARQAGAPEQARSGSASSSGGARPAPSTSGLSRLRRMVSAALALPDREVSWLPPAVYAARQHVGHSRPDVVYSSGPPFTAHLVARSIARRIRVPWVADFRDPWARAPWRDDRFAFERRAWSLLERRVVAAADRVVFVTTTNRDDFARAYGQARAARFDVVTNGCDVTEFDALDHAAKPAGTFVLLHAGSLYGARNPIGLLRAVSQGIATGRLDRTTFRLRFLGRIGIPGVDLAAVAAQLGLERVVEFVSHVPRRDSLQQMLDSSALLIVQPITTVSIPAKLYEYMASGRPILALAEPGGETARLVEEAKAGVVVAADDDHAIMEGLTAVMHLARSGFRPVDRQVFDGERRAEQLRAILQEAMDAGGARS